MDNSTNYTNITYISINKMFNLGTEMINKIKEYREQFKTIIQMNNLEFSFLVETPELLKKRFLCNVKLTKLLDFDYSTPDFVLQQAQNICNDQKSVLNLDEAKKIKLLNEYRNANNDITIVTTYIIDNIDTMINYRNQNIIFELPSLTENDKKFIQKYNKLSQYYSIKDYIATIYCSYETARSAMEKMSNLKLYIKKKAGKKYIYQPTAKLKNTLKGGISWT